MGNASFVLVVLSVASIVVKGANICQHYYGTKTSYSYSCGAWDAWRCTGYKYRQSLLRYCCPEYDHYPSCYPKCNGKTLLEAACDEPYSYDKIVYRTGVTRNRGGGTCTSPNYCTNCQDGFYAYGGQCLICPQITNCNHRRCSTPSDNYCEWCQYEVVDKRYFRGYTRHYDGDRKQCKKACSWRSDSTRCYPGNCTNEIVESCSCTSGFGGNQCDRITEETSILYAEIKLHNPSHETVTTPTDSSETGPQPIRFTNKRDLNEAEIEFHAKFVASGTPPPLDPEHFVTYFTYGIVYGQMKLEYVIGSSSSFRTFSCPATEDYPITTSYVCSRTNTNNSAIYLPTFGHRDKLIFTIQARNGGYLRYLNRENSLTSTVRTSLTGITTTRSYTVQWDYMTPYYTCLQNFGRSCSDSPIDVTDVTDQKLIMFTWNSWSDDLAGVDFYEYEIYRLADYGQFLREANKLFHSNETNLKEGEFNVTQPGMYSIILTAFDKAGNYKSTRSLLFFDDQSVVEKIEGTRTIVKESTLDTNRTWVVSETNLLHVTWLGRFMNERHDLNKWLFPVENNSHVDNLYDDFFERRTVNLFTNVKGVVKFDVNYTVSGQDVKSYKAYTNVIDILRETEVLNVVWEDGEKLDIFVKATDIIGEHIEDFITVYRDVTYPIIENLWLSYGNKTELFVHRLEDFTEMTFEWDAFDYHSGLHSVHWKLYDNFTGSDILHGSSHILAQGNAENITLCEDLYEAAPRGPDCYCTLYHGCFHRHFHIKPEIVLGAGLDPGKDKGLHESDYFIEITVINQAMLTSVLTRKITIDTSPPEEGSVHDGVTGSPEVDYQQDLTLNFHWDGFFDPESGVKYYKYIVTDHCQNKQDVLTSDQIKETTLTFVSHSATVEGTYFITVVAMNRANDASHAVCSDGVTIVTITPSVKNVVVEGARTAPQLIEDMDGQVWVLAENMTRAPYNHSSGCSASPSIVDDIKLIPETRSFLVTCNQLQTSLSKLLQIIPQTSQMVITWDSVDEERIVFDYEIGFASTRHSPAPDILPFRSTKHHRHIRVDNPDLAEGTLFYIVIKSISKSGVSGYQSIGPIIIDVTPPTYHGSTIDVKYEDGILIANWSKGAFQDTEDHYLLSFKFAIGQTKDRTEVAGYQPLNYNSKCTPTLPPECTAIDLSVLDSKLHAHHMYYVTIKVTNLAGLSTSKTSEGYIHDVQVPSVGVVYDINPNDVNNKNVKDVIDVDFSEESNTLAVQWTGFRHPHLPVMYIVCLGTTSGDCDFAKRDNIDDSINQIIFTNLQLVSFQKYYFTVKAITSAGTVESYSDGVMVVDTGTKLSGISIHDGPVCTYETSLNESHHTNDILKDCLQDIDYQTSTTTFFAKWDIPTALHDVIRSSWISVDIRSPVGDYWSTFIEYGYIGSHQVAVLGNLDLQPGRTYRFNIKLCADNLCFPPLRSDGVTVVPTAPVTGYIEVQLDKSKMTVLTKQMYDPDIEDRTEAKEAIDFYEWAIVDGSREAGVYKKWERVSTVQRINNTHVKFDIILEDDIDFAKCKRIALRGYNKASVWSEVQTEIKKCRIKDDHSQIIPRVVIDAIGRTEEGSLKDVLLEPNTPWNLPDVDYIPTKNVLSAVWPSLHHDSYQWGVLEVRPNDALTFYRNYTDLVITDSCSHPDIIKCGHTEHRYINVHFNDSHELIHGKRYAVCVHAERKEIQHEKWTEILDAVSTCSDGVVVDLTAPIGGNVWVGTNKEFLYQTSSSDIYVTWDSFIDVEEEGHSMHSSGISHYFVSVGSVKDGVDVIDERNVGVTNHVSFHGLTLQEGHTYFVSVSGVDFINRTTKVHANPVTIDTTPPVVSSESIYIGGRILTNLSQIEICWKNIFFDIESGIDHYMVGLGSLSGQDDQIKFSRTGQKCGNLKPDQNHQMIEGHPYFVTVKAYNMAGLSTSKSSLANIYDISPPVAGHVYDGKSDAVSSHSKDIDYQTDMSQLSVYWEGFYDPHSVIKCYRVYIGTCSGCYDIINEQVVGAHAYFTWSNVALEAGRTYYSTVTACNTGNMCTSVTSDGVTIDNSPPVPGVVQDGSADYDIEFLSVRNYISIKWFGFNDAQSDIDYIVVRVGTSPGSADIYPPHIISETDMVIITDLPAPLPPGRRIYSTVRVYNKAGLYTESTSNGFLVDVSPPDVLEPPKLSRDIGSLTEDTSVLRSAIRFQWDVEDKQSSILRQYISFVSHQNGEFNSSSVMINGILREYTLTDLELQDGGTYFFKLIVCNGAKICTETESDGVLIDTTPPTSGMFAIGTYHAAELTRHTEGWMTWSDYRLNLSWVGFTDLHTGIDKYYVSVGSQFMGNDLNKVPGLPAEFSHNESTVEYADEGPLQYFVISTQHLVNYEHVFITVWATNNVGLRSHMIHYQFRLISGGYLDLVRRCDALFCLGHCVCSPKGQRCHINGQTCTDVIAEENTKITVDDILDLSGSPQSDVKFTPSSSLLAAKWKITKQQGLSPQWYEWSVGLSSQDSPEGVIDTSTDPLWRHSGQKEEAVFCLKPGQELKELYKYSVFVRVWYSGNKFAVFKSNGITVQSRSILVNDLRGTAVSEKIHNFWKADVDFIEQGSLYTVDWKNVFVSSPGNIKMFNVYLSSYPEGTDLHTVNINIDPTITALNISRLAMSPSVRYYSNVVAKTHSGLQTTASSDGVMVDAYKPICGSVYDGIGLNDMDYQNRSDITASRWHGFTDMESGIVKYSWCMGTDKTGDTCDIISWKNNGMQTSVSFNLHTPLKNGATAYSKIKATDSVGHVSDVMTSNGVKVDTTAPIPVNFVHKDHNYVNNPSFEDTHGCFMNITEISSTNICGFDNCYHPVSWSVAGCAIIIRSDVNAAYEGRSFIFLKGVIQQNVTQLNIGSIYRLSFVTTHLPIQEAMISNVEGSVSFGQQEHVFQMYTKSNQSDIVWHRHVFYTKLEHAISLIKFSSLDNHVGFLVDDIRIEEVEGKTGNHTAIQVHTVELHRWSSIHASWQFVDPESSIKEYLWAVGNTEGSAELQDFKSVGVNTFAYNYNLTLVHASQVYVTVVAINGAGLRNVAYSTAIDIDKTPPVLEEVHDGTGVDIDGQTSNTIAVNWKLLDPESGISFCEWSIGLQPLGNELQSFTQTTDLSSASAILDEESVSQKTIYSTVRCHNKGGLYTTASSDGVTVSEKPPSSDNAEITIIPFPVTEYNPEDFEQGNAATIRMKWTGFTDQHEIMSFVVKLDGRDVHLRNNILNVNKGVTYMSVHGLALKNDVYTASVAATNSMYIRSSQVYTNITVNQSSPSVKEGSSMKIARTDDVVHVDWQDCFIHTGRLVYEVSVGTFLGGADVIQWQETTNHFIDVTVTEKLKTKSTLKFYIYIRAISDSGLFSTMNDDVSL